MPLFKRLGVIFACACLLAASVEARTKKGDKLIQEGRKAQLASDWDLALELYQKALAEDPADPLYQASYRRAQFEASQAHIKKGKELRSDGKLHDALTEFQRAYVIDPGSTIAQQELRTTNRMIEREERKAREAEGQAQAPSEEAGLTPAELARARTEARIARLESLPELKPISPRLNTLKMSGQPVRVLYETVGKLAGINVIFDAEFQAPPRTYSVDLTNATLEEALRYLSMLTRTYWKPLSANTIFVTEDNPTKRRDHEEMVVKVFYLQNVTKVQDLQEIATAVRSVTDIRRFFTYNGQNALLVRGTADQMALAEKLISDLDKPLAEVVVDVVVLEANRTRTRDLAASIVNASGTAGFSMPISFTPGGQKAPSSGDDDNGGSDGGGSTGVTIPVGRIGSLGSKDWSTTLPGALLQAVMSDRSTRVLQRPQVRAADGQKASLRLGDKFPYATGSFQPGVGAVGVSPLVSTQFQFADVGVNVDLTPKIHGEEDVSMHVEIEISSVRDRIDVGGLSQPVIGQRKVIEDIRVRDGEVTLLGGLTQDQNTLSRNGIPGLGQIPLLRWLGFSSESKERNEGELLIAIIPHIVRRPDLDEVNLRGIAAGTEQVVRVNRAPNGDFEAGPEPAPPAAPKPEAPPAAVPEPPKPAPPKPEPPKEGEPAPPAQPLTLRFDPPVVKTKTGATVTVALTVENGTDVYNAPIRFRFDPKMLRLNEIQRGSFLSGDGQQVIFTRNILNDTGDASVILNRLPGSRGVSGTGPLVTLTFQVVGQGSSQVTVPEISIRDSQMQLMPAPAPTLTIEAQ
ncbi:MAG: hypothetical protein KIT09_07090 [Bryobacteraceae bacterium]|nr:hypothetical protein [Bryobacteraceae bacterium]